MKSLRQLTDELLGVRLNATNVSLWQAAVSITEAARVAINDAISAFPTRVQRVYTSGMMHNGVIVLPDCVDNVIRVNVCAISNADSYEIRHWHVVPTSNTTYIKILDRATSARVEVVYRYRQPELPADVGLEVDSLTRLNVSATAAPAHLWPAQGYIEASDVGNTKREVLHYGGTYWSGGGVAEGGFENLTRNIEGFQDPNTEWPQHTHISCCFDCQPSDLRPVMMQAEANMYGFWLRHRALYEQYTAIASSQALGIEDLLILIRTLEGRARAARRSKRRLPPPTSPKLRRPIPR